MRTLKQYLVSLFMLLMLTLCSIAGAEYSKGYMDAYFVALAAGSCCGVYLPDNAKEFDFMRSIGWTVAPYGIKEGGVDTNFVLAHNYLPDIKKHAFMITFRGSANRKDWSLNAKTDKVRFGGNTWRSIQETARLPFAKETPAVHKGFNDYTNTVIKSSVLDEQGKWMRIFKTVNEREDAMLIITGHSLGGAAATLLGARLVDMGFPREKFRVITFGAPAVGNEAFAETYRDKFDLLRIVNNGDPIPVGLQRVVRGYKQIGVGMDFKLPANVSSVQHAMGLYFDESVSQYLKALDIEIQKGTLKHMPMLNYKANVPLVAVCFNRSEKLMKQPYGREIRRFVLDEYKKMLPCYYVMGQRYDAANLQSEQFKQELARVNADYLLVAFLDVETMPTEKYWYLGLEQSLFDKEGKLVSMGGWTKKVDGAVSGIIAGGYNFMEAQKEIKSKLNFVKTQHEGTIGHSVE